MVEEVKKARCDSDSPKTPATDSQQSASSSSGRSPAPPPRPDDAEVCHASELYGITLEWVRMQQALVNHGTGEYVLLAPRAGGKWALRWEPDEEDPSKKRAYVGWIPDPVPDGSVPPPIPEPQYAIELLNQSLHCEEDRVPV